MDDDPTPAKTQEVETTEVDSAFTEALANTPEVNTDATTDTAPVETTTETAEAQPTAFDTLAAMARDAGIDTANVTSSDDLARTLLTQVQSQEPFVSYARQLLPYQDRIREMMAGGQEQEEKEEPQEFNLDQYFQDKYGGPAWKNEFNSAIASGMVVRDQETGLYTAAPGQELIAGTLVNELNAAAAHRDQFWQGLSQGNIYQNMHDVLVDPFMRQVTALIDERLNSVRQEQQAQVQQAQAADSIAKFEQENASWMYQHKDGNLVTNDQGQPVTTEQGQALFDAIAEVRADMQQQGVENPAPEFLLKTALKWVDARQTTENQAELEKNKNDEKKQTFLESAMKRASHSPTATGAVAADDEAPEAMTQLDLDTMFTRAQKGTAA